MKCVVCGEKVQRVAKALFQKLIDRQAKKFMCLTCLANYLETDEAELLEKAQDFKDEGCELFS